MHYIAIKTGKQNTNRWCTCDRERKKDLHDRQHVSPDLVLQEVHVAVKQRVGGGQDSHRLHPRSSLELTLHGHVCKTGQPKVAAFTEISAEGPEQRGGVNTERQQIPDPCSLLRWK